MMKRVGGKRSSFPPTFVKRATTSKTSIKKYTIHKQS